MSEQNPFEKNEGPIQAASTNNPFQAPTAHVEDARPAGDDTLLGAPNRVAAGRGSAWWSGGWGLFREATALWIGMTVTFIVISVLLSQIPIVGSFSSYILMPVIAGGLMLGCRSLEKGAGLSFSHLFAGFQKNFGQLALVGLLNLVGIVVIALGVTVLVLGGSIGSGATFSTIMLGLVLGLGLWIPLAMAMWFAPALVVLNDLPATQAMKLSFQGCWRNFLPFLIYGLIGLLLAIVACIPLALGWLLLVPTIICSIYISYREIFLAPSR